MIGSPPARRLSGHGSRTGAYQYTQRGAATTKGSWSSCPGRGTIGWPLRRDEARLHMARRMLHTGCNALLALIAATSLCRAETPKEDRAGHDYPTAARVEYVQEC